MSKWIEVDALRANINTTFWAEIGKIIESAPSIDICLCGECAYKGEINCPMYYRGRELKPTDFCSHGERSSE